MLHITFSKYDCTIIYQVYVYFHCISITLKSLQNHIIIYIYKCLLQTRSPYMNTRNNKK